MALVYWSGCLAVAAALIATVGRWVLRELKNAQLEKVNAETKGVGDPAKSKAILSTYSRRVEIIEIVSIVLLAASVILQTLDTWKERSMPAQNPDKPTEISQRLDLSDHHISALINQVDDLNVRVTKLESGGSGDRGGGGGDGPISPGPGVAPDGPTMSHEEMARIIPILMERIGTLEKQMLVIGVPA